MKVVRSRDIITKNIKEVKMNTCKEEEYFSEILKQEIEENIEYKNFQTKIIDITSIFLEKKVGRTKTELFDTLVDLN